MIVGIIIGLLIIVISLQINIQMNQRTILSIFREMLEIMKYHEGEES